MILVPVSTDAGTALVENVAVDNVAEEELEEDGVVLVYLTRS